MNKTLGRGILFLIILIGGWMRFHALDRQSLWDDEMSTVITTSIPHTLWANRFETIEVHPPLYFLQLKVWTKLLGRTLVKLRANSAAWGVVCLALFYFLGVRYFGETGGLIALALMAFSPLHLSYSQEARPYALAMALACGALLALERYFEKPDKKRWGTLFGLWTALLYTHYWGSFVVLAQALYGLTQTRVPERKRAVAGAFLFASLAFGLWCPVLLAQMKGIAGLSFWVPGFSFLHPLMSLMAFTSLYFKVAAYVFYLPTRVGILVLLGAPFAILFVWGVWKGPLASVMWLLIGMTIPWLISLRTPGIYVWYRYPTLVFPAFLLLITAGAVRLQPRWLALSLVTICLSSGVWGCHFYFGGWQKANPKAVVQYVHWLKEPDTIVVRPAYFANLYNFYDQTLMVAIDEDKLDSPEKRAALKGKRIIFIAFDAPDPVGAALLQEFRPVSGRYFPAYAHLGVTVWQLR